MEKQATKDSILSRWKVQKKDGAEETSISKAPKDISVPLSNGQQRIWFLQQLQPENSFYNYGESFSLKGDWTISNLKKGIRKIYDANAILRSYCFAGENGVELRVAEDKPLEIKEIDLSHLSEFEALDEAKAVVYEELTTSFDLTNAPLLRVSIIKLTTNHQILNIAMHHIITDEWSMEIFIKQLSSAYTKLCAGQNDPVFPIDIQFRDFAHWDANRTISENEIDYWKKKLSGDIALLQLQTDYERPVKPSYNGAHRKIQFSRKLSEDLANLAKESQVTPFVLLLSIFNVLLYRHTGQTDILVGSPIANRSAKELENIMGFFVDTLILRNPISAITTFKELLTKVKKNTLEAFSNKDVPYDVLVKELNPVRSTAINPFFQVMFVYNAGANFPTFGQGLIFEKVDLVDSGTSKFDLTLFISEEDEILSASFEYATDLFEESTIDRLLSHLELLAKGVVKNNNTVLSEIPMCTEEESAFFLEIPKAPVPKIASSTSFGIHRLFEESASKNPDANAISFGDVSMTYGQLNNRANSIAFNLLEFTGGENVLIGLCIDRSLEMIIGLLAILKSGSAYVPLDPEYPEERIKFIIEDSKTKLVLTEQKYAANFNKLNIRNVSISDEKIRQIPAVLELPEVSPDNLAYVIYTSGSTGKPKGVPISHQNIISATKARFSFYNENPSAFLLLSSISFDSSKAGIFWTLCSGGNLVIAQKRQEQDMVSMEESIAKYKISHLLTLPTLYGLMLEYINSDVLKHLKTVIVAGETCPIHLPEQHFESLQNTKLFNEYGPTEATVWCTAYQVKPNNPFKSISIGKAIEGTKIHLLDTELNHVPYGSVGEIYIASQGLSKGYLGKPELTKTKFVENPFISGNGKNYMYRSGDLGRYQPDGNIEFLGRADSQIKLLGFRIELGEVEKTLLTHPDIKEATVIMGVPEGEPSNSTGFLLAYVVPKSKLDTQEVKTYLKKLLPKHMVPSKVITLVDFVKLPNGKVDKKHLETIPVEMANEDDIVVKEVTETESKLIGIWEKILGFGGLAVNDNFFEIGGDSIMTIQVIAEARKMGMAISPNQLFECQTVKELALFVDRNKQKEDKWDYIVPLRKEGSKKPLFCIHAGGGHVFFYNKLTDYLKADIPIYALQPSGVYGDKRMHKNVREMTEAYLESIHKVQPHGPFNILVYCFSVAVGNEMALMLKDINEEINLIVMDTMTAPAVLNTPRRLKIRILNFLIRFFKSPLRSIKNMVISKYALIRLKWRSNFEIDKESRELEKLRVNLMQLSQSYQWKPFKGTISLILTKKDHEALNKETIRSWKEIAKDEVTIIQTKGSHRELFDVPYVQYTAEAIESCMLD